MRSSREPPRSLSARAKKKKKVLAGCIYASNYIIPFVEIRGGIHPHGCLRCLPACPHDYYYPIACTYAPPRPRPHPPFVLGRNSTKAERRKKNQREELSLKVTEEIVGETGIVSLCFFGKYFIFFFFFGLKVKSATRSEMETASQVKTCIILTNAQK